MRIQRGAGLVIEKGAAMATLPLNALSYCRLALLKQTASMNYGKYCLVSCPGFGIHNSFGLDYKLPSRLSHGSHSGSRKTHRPIGTRTSSKTM